MVQLEGSIAHLFGGVSASKMTDIISIPGNPPSLLLVLGTLFVHVSSIAISAAFGSGAGELGRLRASLLPAVVRGGWP